MCGGRGGCDGGRFLSIYGSNQASAQLGLTYAPFFASVSQVMVKYVRRELR